MTEDSQNDRTQLIQCGDYKKASSKDSSLRIYMVMYVSKRRARYEETEQVVIEPVFVSMTVGAKTVIGIKIRR